MAGDSIRYSIGWGGWAVVVGIGALIALVALIVGKPGKTLLRVPIPLALLLGLMALSLIWSQYREFTAIGLVAQVGTTVFALFLANQFGWRQLLNIFANTLRVVLAASLLFELFAAVFGPIKPIFPNYEGDEPPSASYLWSQGNLFEGDRIQGIMGNANLLAFTAVLGIMVFLVEYIVTHKNRSIPLGSLILAVLLAALAKSAGMTLAIGLIAFAALIAIFSEGRDRVTRHKIYGYGIWALFGIGVLGLISDRKSVV